MSGPSADTGLAGRFFPVTERGRRIVVLDSATHAHRHAASPEARAAHDVVVNASYAGVYCAHLLDEVQPIAVIGLDCGIGKDGAGISGLWYFEGRSIAAAAADISNLEHGNGMDLYDNGVISVANGPALACGVRVGMRVRDAAYLLLTHEAPLGEQDVENREVVADGINGHRVVCTNSIADALPEDRDTNVLCTAGHTGRSVVEYITGFRPWGFICSDGAMGRDGSGIAALEPANDAGIPGAAVSAHTARMGDGHSTYYDGVISATNALAHAAGVRVGQTAIEAARLLANR